MQIVGLWRAQHGWLAAQSTAHPLTISHRRPGEMECLTPSGRTGLPSTWHAESDLLASGNFGGRQLPSSRFGMSSLSRSWCLTGRLADSGNRPGLDDNGGVVFPRVLRAVGRWRAAGRSSVSIQTNPHTHAYAQEAIHLRTHCRTGFNHAKK